MEAQSYSVDFLAYLQYINIFYGEIGKTINEMYNNNFKVIKGNTKFSFTFLDDYAILLTIQDNFIESMKPVSYDVFIPNKLINQLKEVSDLPPRLTRLNRIGTDRFRAEIKNSLQMGRIVTREQNFAEWLEYGIKLEIDESLNLNRVIVSKFEE